MRVLKIGGSLLSPRREGGAFDERLTRRLGRELAPFGGEVAIAHGVGAAGRRWTGPDARLADEEAERAGRVRAAVERLHRDVLEAMREARAPIESLAPEELFVLRDAEVSDFDPEPVRWSLRRERIPLTHGTLLKDAAGGYSVLSSDVIVEHIARTLRADSVLWGTDVDGVLDPIGRPIARIAPAERPETQDRSEDPTGGMGGKLAAAFRLSADGIPSLVFNAGDADRVRAVLRGEDAIGTAIPAGG